MVHLHPFAAHSVAPSQVQDFVSLPVDFYSEDEIEKEITQKPHSFLGIIRPFSKEQYSNVRARFLQSPLLIQESKPSLYIYEIEDQRNTCKGVISGVSCEDLKSGVVLPHEETLEKREKIFENYLREVKFNAEPVLLSYPDSKSISLLLDHYSSEPPYYNFSYNDQTHRLWKIAEKNALKSLSKAFNSVEKLYVADGHHRLASSFRLSQSTDVKEAQYCMSYLLPSSSLQLDSFYRIIDISNKLSTNELMNRLEESFEISKTKNYKRPQNINSFGMFIDGSWYSLNTKEKSRLNAVELLHATILLPILQIHDLRNDPCISYGYSKNSSLTIEQKLQGQKGFLGITHFPINFENIQSSAEEGKMLPPKSSYIEPKILSGMLLHSW